mmetsp:Transcript_119756/g.382262  ORF Transcript_119756/g.382262 Transcript_119756/m.382262 type:complete len:546 (-) Transcript_119756:286-1923(-)
MMLYSKRWGGFPLIFRIHGTSWPYGVFPGLVAVAFSLGLGYSPLDEHMRKRSEFMEHPYPFQLYAFVVGNLVVFRTNFAYQRYWEGRTVIAQMSSKWLDGACMSVAFDAPGSAKTPYLEGIGGITCSTSCKPTANGAPSHEEFVANILHLFSLMHALALLHLRGDADLNNLKPFDMLKHNKITGGASDLFTTLPEVPKHSDQLSVQVTPVPGWTNHRFHRVYKHQQLQIIGPLLPEERAALETQADNNLIHTEARVTMVEGWIMRRLIARQKHENCDMGQTSPPILSRLYQVISDGCVGFGQASKITDTPFPFPYQNLLQVFLWVYAFTVPVVMNAWLKDTAMRACMTFLAVWCYFAMHQVGNILEDPYIPYDPNELPLGQIQHSYNAKLLSFALVPDFLQDVFDPSAQKQMLEGFAKFAAPPIAEVKSVPDGAATTLPSTSSAAVGKLAHAGLSASVIGKHAVGETKLQNDPSVAAQLPPDELGALVSQNLQELAAAQTRCLRLVGVLEGTLAHSERSGACGPGGPIPTSASPTTMPEAVRMVV